MARGLDGMDIFGSDTDRAHFLRLLDKYLTAFHNRCYAWALMSNHYHLLPRLSASNLGLMMRRLNGSCAGYFNKNLSRRGYLFMDRCKSIATQQQLYLQDLIRYIHLNPVRAGLVRDLRSLVSYEWSSHRDYVSRPRHPWCNVSEGLRKFSLKRSEQRRRYMEFLAAGIDGDMTHAGAFEPLREVQDERVVGDPEFVRAALQRDKSACTEGGAASAWRRHQPYRPKSLFVIQYRRGRSQASGARQRAATRRGGIVYGGN
jgi:REP element-mobilizing transposase RayT